MTNRFSALRASAIALLCGLSATACLAAGSLARGDKTFVDKAAAGGMMEVQASQLATTKASDPQVKSFAEMMIQDHTAANNELKQIAQQKGVEVPATLPSKEQKELDKLAKKSGADFDRSYIAEVGLKDHHKAIQLFEKESKSGKDADLQTFAAKTLPTLQKHLQAAEQLKGDTRAGGVGTSPMAGTSTSGTGRP